MNVNQFDIVTIIFKYKNMKQLRRVIEICINDGSFLNYKIKH